MMTRLVDVSDPSVRFHSDSGSCCLLYHTVYVLAGIVGAGFLLGGITKPTKRQVDQVKSEVAEKVQEAKKEVPVLPDSELAGLVSKAEGALKSK